MKLDLIFFYIMKRFILLTLCLFTAVFTACDDEKTDNRSWFREPVTSVEGTTVTVKCLSLLGEAVLETTQPRFVCRPAAGEGETVELPAEVDETILSARFTDLLPETVYLTYAYVVVGDSRLSSPTVAFRTGSGGEDPDPEPEPEPEPGDPEFGELAAVSVTASSATLEGEFSYDGAEPVSALYFSYAAGGGSARRADIDPVQPGKVHADISGLSASTAYTFRLCVEIGGETYRSAAGSFTTLAETAPEDRPRYSGWAELPAEESADGDLYYAYHLCDGAPDGRNYSVCYSAELGGAVWVAYPMHWCYTEGDAGGQNKAWQYDPVIPESVQPNLKSSYVGGYSRGHMIASNDRQSSKATNRQTFYYTNMSPQIQNGFNGGIWATLEHGCHEMICSDTLYMVTGAHFANRNNTCEDKQGREIVVPTHYYKVLIRSKAGNTHKPLWELSADEIECAGYWLEHKAYSGASPSQFIKSVEWIEEQTGMEFFPNVPNAPKERLDKSFWKI